MESDELKAVNPEPEDKREESDSLARMASLLSAEAEGPMDAEPKPVESTTSAHTVMTDK